MFKKLSPWHTFFQLIRRDLVEFRYNFKDKMIDTTIMLFTNVMVFGYVMTTMGLGSYYGPFILVGSVASFGFFETMARIGKFISDITGSKTISYQLTLPLPSSMVFAYYGISWAICNAIISFCLLPIGKIFLFTEFDLSRIQVWKFILIFPVINLFFGFLALWLSNTIRNMSQIGKVWFRFISPMFMFGAYFYPWEQLFIASPFLAYCNLVNPFVYAMEGLRSTLLESDRYLPFFLSFFMLIAFTSVIAFDAIRRLKRRLDAV